MKENWSLQRRSGLAVVLALAALLLLAVIMNSNPAISQASYPARGAQPSLAWTRTLEPAILTGDQLPEFDGVSLHDLFVYTYLGGAWQQIPFQFDEVNAGGAYTSIEDGLLDANDELAFMAMDLGNEATPLEWIADADSQTQPRSQVQVTNPLNPAEMGWVYVYRSSTLSPAFGDYVAWDAANKQVVAGTYVMGYDPNVHVGTESLELNGSGADALDRTKIRLSITCWIGRFPFQQNLTEDDLPQQDPTPGIDGPVRVGGGTTGISSWSYYSVYQSRALLDTDVDPPPHCTNVTFNWFRTSDDWLDPAGTGMAPATYYDDNLPGGVLIDGNLDSVPSLPVNAWKQVSGGQGSTVRVLDISVDGGTIQNYFKDFKDVDPDDTGDGKPYGDAGFRVDDPTGQVFFDSLTFVLDPNQPNVGQAFRDLFDNPLQTTATAQDYPPFCMPGDVSFDWAPNPVRMNAETTFTAAVGAGKPPFVHSWEFGDDNPRSEAERGDGSSGTGNPIVHVFALSGTFPVTLTVSNACGQTVVGDTVEVICEPVAGASLAWEPLAPGVGQVVTLTAEAAGSEPISYAWALGDGAVALGDVVTHTYAHTGTYGIVLTATNDCGQQAVSDSLAVICDPVTEAEFTWEPLTPEVGRPVILSAQANGSPSISFAWDLGDGSQATGPEVAHTYSQTGTYTLVLTATNACGEATVSHKVVVVCNPAMGAGFTWIPLSPEVGHPVSFTATASGTIPISYTWDFGDGAFGSGAAVAHTYTLSNTYGVALTATNACGTSAPAVHSVQVVEPPLPVVYLPLLLKDYTPPPPPPPGCYPAELAAVGVGRAPHGVAVNSGAQRLYVANHDDDTLSIINSQTYTVVATKAVGDGPNGVAYNSANDRIYVANRSANTVSVLRASDYDPVKTIAVGSQPNGLATNAVTNRIYVANFGDGTVSVIDGATDAVFQTLGVGGGSEPAQVAVNPNTNKAYVSLHGSGRVAVISGSGSVNVVDVYSGGAYGIAVDTLRNLVYVAAVDTFRIAVMDGSTDTFLGWAEIHRMSDGKPVPLRMIAVNPLIGTSGHIFVTTAEEDLGWNKLLLLHKGWPEYFAQPIALDLNEPREGIAFEPSTLRVFAASRKDNLMAVYLDGEPPCPYNFAEGYEITVCVAGPDGTCTQVTTH